MDDDYDTIHANAITNQQHVVYTSNLYKRSSLSKNKDKEIDVHICEHKSNFKL